MAVADRIVVMRTGKVVGETSPAATDEAALARMMVGRDVVLRLVKEPSTPAGAVLSVDGLHVLDDRGLEAVRGLSLDVRAGEIVGVAGVDGNGQRELVEALVGLRRPAEGTIRLRERDITHDRVRDTIAAGVSHVPEDRHRRGLVLEFDLAENLILGDHTRSPYSSHGVLRPSAVTATARKRIADYDVRAPSERVLAGNLSGGNQQKLVLARELGRDPELLIAAQPTRGLDVGAIEFVHRRILDERAAGKAVLLVSLELEEVLSLADRILVIFEGRIVKELAADEATAENVGYFMTGGGEEGYPGPPVEPEDRGVVL